MGASNDSGRASPRAPAAGSGRRGVGVAHPRFSRSAALLLALLTFAACSAHRPAVPEVSGRPRLAAAERPHLRPQAPLDARERRLAETAWRYFERNLQPATGLVNAVDGYPSATLWDTASYLAALVSAHELGLIDAAELDRRLRPLLATLAALDLFRGELPNKVYDTRTAAEVDYGNRPGEIGFSALDIGRLLIWLRIVAQRFPAYADLVDAVVVRWNFCRAVDPCGTLYGATVGAGGRVEYLQEGRLGYEEYAARGFALWGFCTERASRPEPWESIVVYGIEVPYDARHPHRFGAHNYVVTESWVLDGIELGWGAALGAREDWAVDFAEIVYRVQEERHRRTGMPTARTEHQLAGPPYFVYDTVYTDGYAWNTIAEDGTRVPWAAAVAVKAAVGMWALWETDYTALLLESVAGLEGEGGFYEGFFESGAGTIETFTANNNGIVLEALLYRTEGVLLRPGAPPSGAWEAARRDPLRRRAQCLPAGGCEEGERCR